MSDHPGDGADTHGHAQDTVAEERPRLHTAARTVRWLAFDALIAVVAGWFAVALRYDRFVPTDAFLALLPWVLLPAIVIPAANLVTGVTSISWRRPSLADIVHTSLAAGIALGAELVIFYGVLTPLHLPGTDFFPRSYWPIQAAIALVIALLIRSRGAWLYRGSRASNRDGSPDIRTILYGAGQAGTVLVDAARSNAGAGVHPVAFLDDDPKLRGQYVAGLPVLGDSTVMKAVAARVRATQVLITMPSAQGTAVRRVVAAATAAGLKVRTVPSLGELISGSLTVGRTRSVNVADLLRRPATELERHRVRAMVSGKRVLVTGAAGSIGSEILRQLLDAGPALLVAFDQAESALYEIERDVSDRIKESNDPPPNLAIELGSVSDAVRLRELFRRYPVDIVVHAAAYKHVPMLESHPSEAVVANVGGTLELLEQAQASGARRFVLISTDKAVNPTSVMGATKRLAELAVVAAGQRFDWDAVVVRFGNVLGSAGSVIPLFERQMARGAPITITHPDATRFFMTIPEASQLVLNAAALGGSGTTYILKMGEPVRIVDLANDLIRLAGYQEGAVEIEYTGLRPGERLHETLFHGSETAEPTPDSRILRALIPPSPAGTTERLRDLVARARLRQVSGADVIALANELGADSPSPADLDAVDVRSAR